MQNIENNKYIEIKLKYLISMSNQSLGLLS